MPAQQQCLYAILEVEAEATDEEIKKAYRRQALIWHPGACCRMKRG